ncbi:DUF6080 domain-containing protein [Porphyromonas asaccharolytica]|uniref:Glycosyltransferase RgtA/B/C/D-like domain-containing protein n=1 Tax=Porphyromonas asaccharolytica (strain ATCC 25260 / DSM 20707 / BCRC 10618 / CCUG 7834 / JCM 6326 / LMG 13178 / VPI 4198 / B440) TaxID=879243 RepID=F4KKH4_PORAD|nr:DUF6080 domain-containing protein [Porphyromonas asaccharolytica]AEE12899.1 hypothetical protein Poras_0956 [Porphyromonas asaccharolytica DSM 20707]
MGLLNKQLLERWRVELLCALGVWVLLALLALYIYSTGLLMPQDDAIGAYLGYDNYFRFTTRGGAWDVSHPLITPLYLINRVLLVPLLGEGGALVGILFASALLMAIAVAGCCGYLRHVVQLDTGRSLLLSGLLLSTFTVMTLSFTVESYPLSMALLVLSLLCLSSQLKQEKRLSGWHVTLWSLLLGGVTLTNFAKPLSLLLLSKEESLWQRARKAFLPTLLLLTLVVAVGWFYQQRGTSQGAEEPMLTAQVNDLLRFQTRSADLVPDFFGHPLLISDLEMRELHGETVLRPTPYACWAMQLLPWGVVLLLLSMIWIGRRYPLAWAIPLYLAVDVAVHLIGGYGLDEAVIFGGHWVFLVPMALGWLYLVVPKQAYRYMDLALLLLSIYMCTHNLSIILLHIK